LNSNKEQHAVKQQSNPAGINTRVSRIRATIRYTLFKLTNNNNNNNNWTLGLGK